VDFLRAIALGEPMELGHEIVVIGGGNVAYDVARSAIRPGDARTSQEDEADFARGETVAYDVARSALRLSGDKQVHVVCLEQRHEMPADAREIEEGEEEGVVLHNGRGPLEILVRDGAAAGLRTVRCVSVFDVDRRFHPVFDPADTLDIEGDSVMFAIGQTSDLGFLAPEDGIESERGLIKVDPSTYQTTAPDVFACGDIAHGPRLFINAIASAQVAARSMHDFLRRSRTDVVLRRAWQPAVYAMADQWERLPRQEPPVTTAATRAASNTIVENNYPDSEARRQAARCLRCNINTVFDTTTCIACNGCVDVCPMSILRLVGLSQLVQDDSGYDLAAAALGIPREALRAMPPAGLNAAGGLMLKDETTCIRCGLCAAHCPTHAVTMQRFDAHWECVSVSTPNPKIRYG
jgi:ferredoxin